MNPGTPVNPAQVAAYIRWSTDEQSEGTTLEVQTDACRHYILAQGWEWSPDLVFVDDGYSGGGMDRPALNRLRALVREGRISCVVVFKLDRLSRNVVDTVKLVLEEWEGTCYLKSTREPVDTTTPSGKMFFYMLASYAEWERSVIKERTLSGKVKRAQQGRNPGYTPPFGYRTGAEPGAWAVDPREAEVVQRIFAEYLSGKGLHQIAALLNDEPMRPRRARRWHATTISVILRNVAYVGVLEYGRTAVAPKRAGKARLAFAEPRFARVEGALPAIIAVDDFAQVQEILALRGAPQARRTLNASYLLTGIARCRCGSTLRGDQRAARGIRYYRCSTARSSHPGRCDAMLLPAAELEQAVVARVRQAFDRAVRAALLAAVREDVAREAGALSDALQRLHDEQGALGRRRRRLDADYDAGELPARIYTERLAQLEQEQAALEGRIAETRERTAALETAELDLDEYTALAGQVDAWEHLTPEQRKQFLRCAIAQLRAYRPRRGPGDAAPPPIEVDLAIRRITTPTDKVRPSA